ncbi:MAG TPA: glutamate 5-kinase [Rhabdochlamydiaceae bacterium]|nr:glutamate 5-kinase [Rhabdochlamydiaceae bacterium]
MHRIVIKVGTSTLTQGSQKLSRRYMLSLVQQIAHLRSKGLELLLVCSGATAMGRELLSSDKMELIVSKQTFASIGQVKLMQVWSELFSLFDIRVGQVLLTKDDFSSDKQHITRDILSSLLQHKIIPIVNENGALATKELCIGNNDRLAALIANLISADTVILLTDQEGLYTADPRRNSEAVLIPIVSQIDEKIYALAGGSFTSLGTGGMATKIEAAQMAAKTGAQTIIASSFHPNVLIDLAEGRRVGTLFLEKEII